MAFFGMLSIPATLLRLVEHKEQTKKQLKGKRFDGDPE